MDSDRSTLAKPSQNSLNPRNEELFEMLVDFVERIGGVENLVIADEMLLIDIEYAAEHFGGFEGDFVSQIPAASQRMVLLKRAKRDALRRYFQEYVDQVEQRRNEIEELDDEEKSGLSGFETIEWELANYLPDFVGRPPDFPQNHAWLMRDDQRFFGKPLSPHDRRYWTKQLLAAAGLGDQPVVYFVSLDDPSKVKIGWTGNLPRKLTFFRNSTPSEPTVHVTLRGGYSLEQQLHRRFKADRIVREWFRLSPDIDAFIRERVRK
jgi:hypothetical protein